MLSAAKHLAFSKVPCKEEEDKRSAVKHLFCCKQILRRLTAPQNDREKE